MKNLGDVFIMFRKESFGHILNLSSTHKITHKEKQILHVACENATNTLSYTVDMLGASKQIAENDFDWMMQLYVFMCLHELHDILDAIRRQDDERIKSILDVSKPELIEHFMLIIGGDDVSNYVSKVIQLIEGQEKTASSYNDFLLGRILSICAYFEQNHVDMKKIPKEELLKISETVYEKSLMNLTKLVL